MAMIRGPRLDTSEMLLIKDERSCFHKACDCRKGHWSIIKDNQLIATVDFQKTMCGKKLFYRMKDADGVALAKIRMTPTCAECLNSTCRKCTCDCCCLCKICDILRCRCLFKRPAAKILAPVKKSMIKVYIGGKCCSKPKFPVIFPVLYVPGQDGTAKDDEEGDTDEGGELDPQLDPNVEDELNVMESSDKNAWKKYTKMGPKAYDKKKKCSMAGQEGKPVTVYMKNPKYCCVGFKRDISKLCCNCLTELGEVDAEEMGFSAENLEDFTAAADIAGEMISNENAAAALNGLSNAAASSDDGS